MKLKNTFILTLLGLSVIISTQGQNTVVIDASTQDVHKINRFIHSQFSEHLGNCIYGGLWVGENSTIPNKNGIRTDVVNALNKIKVPALRWPGGCFADEYHWMDGIGPKGSRPKMINTNWGGITEDNSFGSHEFMELCNQLNCEPYISGNLGSGTVKEMSQWVEYLNSDNDSPMTALRKANGREESWGIKFWGVGNESWGCGGRMKPDYYTDLALHYSNFLKNYGDNHLNLIAVGPNAEDYNWTDVVMGQIGHNFWGLSLHYYTNLNSSATQFKEDEWFDVMKTTLKMEEIVTKHSAIMDKYDPQKRTALVVDEWGTWYQVEPGTNPGFLYQQNSLRDALVAGINLNIFHNHADRVQMTAIAQIVNVLQSVILTKDNKMVLTPTYHVFDMYKVHQDAYLLPSTITTENYTYDGLSIPALSISSSMDKNGKIHVSVCNLHATKTEKIACTIKGFTAKNGTGQIITAGQLNAFNSYENPNEVTLQQFNGFSIKKGQVEIEMPAHSVVTLELEGTMETTDNSVKLKNPAPGLNYQFYKGSFFKLADLDTLKPVSQGIVNSLVFPSEAKGFNFGVIYKGYIRIEEPGFYNFSMASDDGSRLTIDNKVLIDIDDRHGVIEREGFVFLQKGYHAFETKFFQAGGGCAFNLFMLDKVGDPKLVPDEMFWHEK